MRTDNLQVIISTDKSKLDIGYIYSFLSNSYWANTRTITQIEETIKNCICYGVYKDEKQIGFARVLTDKVTFAYLMDVFIDEAYQRQGIAKRLMQTILDTPEFKDLPKWFLGTKDAHGLYKKFGFTALTKPEMWMEKLN